MDFKWLILGDLINILDWSFQNVYSNLRNGETTRVQPG